MHGAATLLGQTIGSYRLVRELGAGGMGRVYEGIHDRLARRAAIKVLHGELARREDLVRRLFNEARAVNVVSHPGVVNIFEMGRLADGGAYLIMEFLEGETLARRMLRTGGRVPRAMRICRQVASILAAAHDQGIVHRDIKPENVMLVPDPEMPDGERVKLLDFGIAKFRGDGTPLEFRGTCAGTVLGTPIYMAPEQCRGAVTIDESADVYALGVVIYELLSGRPPFLSDSPGALMAMHLTDPPPDLRQVAPGLPNVIYALVSAMLAKEPHGRPAMRAVAEVLSRLDVPASAATPEPRPPAPTSPSQSTPPPVSRSIVRTDVLRGRSPLRVTLLALGTASAALLALAVLERRPWHGTRSEAQEDVVTAVAPSPPAAERTAGRLSPRLALPEEVPAVEPPPAGWGVPAKIPRKRSQRQRAPDPDPSSPLWRSPRGLP